MSKIRIQELVENQENPPSPPPLKLSQPVERKQPKKNAGDAGRRNCAKITLRREKLENSADIFRKILLLGCSWGGKSTVFKGLRQLHGQSYSQADRWAYREIVHSTVISALQLLLEHALQTKNLLPEERNRLRELGSQILEPCEIHSFEPLLLKQARALWVEPVIQDAFQDRNVTFHIPDTIAYFMDCFDRIVASNYSPTVEDLLHCRVRTAGAASMQLEENNYLFSVYDVGSERNERKKWRSIFRHVTDLVFVVAVDEFDMNCYEDNCTNRLIESLNVWLDSVQSHFFAQSNIYLVFNKMDLFVKKVRQGTFSLHFKGFTGDSTSASQVLRYIVQCFLSRISSRKIHLAFTNALDLDKMKQFWTHIFSTPSYHVKDMSNHNKYAHTVQLHEEWYYNYNNFQFPIQIFPSANEIISPYHMISFSDLILTTPESKDHVFLHVHSLVLQKFPAFYSYLKTQPTTCSVNFELKNLVVVQDCDIRTLQHVLSFMYSQGTYPFANWLNAQATTCQPQSETLLESLDKKWNFIPCESPFKKKSISKQGLYQTIVSLTQYVNSLLDKKRRKRELLDNLSSNHRQCESIVTLNDQFLSSFQELNRSYTPFQQAQQQVQYDLSLFMDLKVVKSHKFLLSRILPSFRTVGEKGGLTSFALPRMLRAKSVRTLFGYLYTGRDRNALAKQLIMDKSLNLRDITDMIVLSRMCDFTREEDAGIMDVLTKKLESMFTVENVACVYNIFCDDFIDLQKHLPRDFSSNTLLHRLSSSHEQQQQQQQQQQQNTWLLHTHFRVLPVEILFIIYQFLGSPTVGSKIMMNTGQQVATRNNGDELVAMHSSPSFYSSTQSHTLSIATLVPMTGSREALTENLGTRAQPYIVSARTMNQDELTMLLFTPLSFAHYLCRVAPQYLIWQTDRTNFEAIRNLSILYAAKHWNDVIHSKQYSLLSPQQKQRLAVHTGRPCSLSAEMMGRDFHSYGHLVDDDELTCSSTSEVVDASHDFE